MFRTLFRERYINWEDYRARINFLDQFHWQQSVRRENIRNSKDF